nr:reverse transcriptase domain-containing protein [Tanacetum cinerariifolium]
TLGTLSSNTIPNPKGEMKAVTTRTGLAYEGPSIPTNSSPEKVAERETDEITDKEQPNCQGSTAHIQSPVVPTHSLLTNKDKLFELAKVPLNENFSAMLLKKLLEKLGDPGKFLIPSDRSITRPKGVAEDVFIKVGKFHFPTDFVVVDFEADHRVPLILGRSFLRTDCALIDVYGEEISLRVNDESTQINVLRDDFNKQEENRRRNLNNDMRSILGSFFQNQASTLGTLSSNTIPNPKGEMKAVTTRTGLAYEGPSIPTNSSPEKVAERETDEITDKEQPNCQGSTAHIQSPVVPTHVLEPDVPKTQPKPNIIYPSRLNDQKLHEKATNQMEKFF